VPNDELSVEVRALRAELKQASSVCIRTQLLTARLQLQEQRIVTAARQLTDVQTLLADVRQEIADIQRRTERYERAATDIDLSPEQQRELRRQFLVNQRSLGRSKCASRNSGDRRPICSPR
jgi:hypothetical protein